MASNATALQDVTRQLAELVYGGEEGVRVKEWAPADAETIRWMTGVRTENNDYRNSVWRTTVIEAVVERAQEAPRTGEGAFCPATEPAGRRQYHAPRAGVLSPYASAL